MRLIDALERSRRSSAVEGDPFSILIACGFTPLHLATYLTAYASQRLPQRRVSSQSGLFGDLTGTLEAAAKNIHSAVVVFVEWGDLDPRLSARQAPPAGGIRTEEIVRAVTETCARLARHLHRLGALGCPVSVSLPTVPPLGWGHQPHAVETSERIAVDAALQDLAREATQAGLRIVSRETLDLRSPVAARHDIRAELQSGFPYTLPHTVALAEITARLLVPDAPKKAVITDLDNTLWSGIAGEIGPEQVAWDFDRKASLHGHYQQVLAWLAEAGVLIGVASKNDPNVVEAALARRDLVIPRSRIFPVEAHWNPKSESVARILKAWNIGAEAVALVDDSPMELAEVQQAFPEITCLEFQREDPASIVRLFRDLRNLCGRQRVGQEDRLRALSLEQGQQFSSEASASDTEQFLASLQARITFQDGTADPRSLELVNKTNQFNLNGIRYTEDAWSVARNGNFVWTVSYEDRFGALGKIAVLAGEQKGERLLLRDMVLSCRAFSRRVEHAAVRFLLQFSGASEIEFQYRPTDRNGPLRDFLAALLAPGELPQTQGSPVLRQDAFEGAVPALYHEVLCKTRTYV